MPQALRDNLDQECLEVNRRVDKLNVDRMADVSDTHNKIALFGKSAQRHLDALRHFVIRECQNLFDLTTKTCSIVFDAVREVKYLVTVKNIRLQKLLVVKTCNRFVLLLY